MRSRTLVAIGALLVLAAGCDNSNRPGGRGTVSAVLVSPNGAEGAAVLDVTGTVEKFEAPSGLTVHTTPSATGTRVIIVSQTAGALSVLLTVPDVSQPPSVAVVEVADAQDQLRASLAGYRVEFQ